MLDTVSLQPSKKSINHRPVGKVNLRKGGANTGVAVWGGAGARSGAVECMPPPKAFKVLKHSKNTVSLNKTCLQATAEAPAYDFSSGYLLKE